MQTNADTDEKLRIVADTDEDSHELAAGLFGQRGDAFWRRTTAVYDLSDAELELLTEICRTLDALEALEDALDADGIVTPGSTGQLRVNPALAELRQQRVVLGKLLGQLSLPDDEGSVLPTPAQARAKKAAESRWARRVPRG